MRRRLFCACSLSVFLIIWPTHIMTVHLITSNSSAMVFQCSGRCIINPRCFLFYILPAVWDVLACAQSLPVSFCFYCEKVWRVCQNLFRLLIFGAELSCRTRNPNIIFSPLPKHSDLNITRPVILTRANVSSLPLNSPEMRGMTGCKQKAKSVVFF